MRYLPSLLRVQILSNDGICLGANINKFDQMWYLLHICIDFAVVVNPFFRAVFCRVTPFNCSNIQHINAYDSLFVVYSKLNPRTYMYTQNHNPTVVQGGSDGTPP